MTAATDVVVVGAGLAGLAAASRLVDAGAEVVVLEARNRVGGLTLPTADGTLIDHGAHWIGPTQDPIAALAERVGVTSYPTYERGVNIEFYDGRSYRYDGDILDGEDPVNAAAIGQAIGELEAMAATVPLEAPWAAEQALAWDSQTVETWLQTRVSSERIRAWLREIIRGTLAGEARDASLLHTLFYIRSGGGMAVLIGTGGGAQERRFHQGAQTVSIRLAEVLGDRVVLGAPAQVVRQEAGGVVVEAGGRALAGGQAILAVPPAVAGRIGYRPAMPGWRNQLTQRASVIKLHALYDEPFWRHEGLSGFAISDSGPVSVVYDDTPEAGSPGVLVAFMEGELRAELRGLTTKRQITHCARLRDRLARSLEHRMTVRALRLTAHRIKPLAAEAAGLRAELERLVAAVAPWLLELPGVGPISAAQVLVSWSYAGRLRSEAAFAALAGANPIPASSGQVTRHRLNRSGDRQLNRALHTIVLARLRDDVETRAYAARRRAEGKSVRDVRRCLKRAVARQLFKLLERHDRAVVLIVRA